MPGRFASIECFRVLAIVTIILGHSNFLAYITHLADGNFVIVLSGTLLTGIAVPFFLLTAGYFFRQSIVAHGNPAAQLRRYVASLAGMLIGWLCIYIVTPPDWPEQVLHQGWWQPFYTQALKNMDLLAAQHINLFLEGNRPVWHLWFLPALMVSLAALTLVASYRLERYVVPFIVVLYVSACIEKSMAGHFFNSSIHLGLWMNATMFTAIGWWLAGRALPSVPLAWSLIVGGAALALVEGEVMHAMFHDVHQAIHHHYLLGGIVLNTGIFAFALAHPTLGQSTPFPFLAQFTLGVYLSHIFVLYTVRGPINWLVGNHFPMRGAIVAIIVYIVALLFTMMLTRIPILQNLVVKPLRKLPREGDTARGGLLVSNWAR